MLSVVLQCASQILTPCPFYFERDEGARAELAAFAVVPDRHRVIHNSHIPEQREGTVKGLF